MRRWGELIAWVESKTELTFTDRLFINGEIHKVIFGIPSCEWFESDLPEGEGQSCYAAWPSECGDFAQRNGDLPYEPCGRGQFGAWLGGVWVDRAPNYTGEFSPKEIAGMLRALQGRFDAMGLVVPRAKSGE